MSESKTLANALRITLLLGCALYFFARFDLTSLIFPRWNEPRQPEPAQQIQVDRQQDVAVQTPQSAPAQPTALSGPCAEGARNAHRGARLPSPPWPR